MFGFDVLKWNVGAVFGVGIWSQVMPEESLGRRDFLRTSVAALLTGATFANPTHVTAEEPSPKAKFKRMSLSEIGDGGYQLLEKVFGLLKQDKGRILTDQAKLYAEKSQHRNSLFLPWLRAQLYFFESICRKVVSNEEFTIPYWNVAHEPIIPSRFFKDSSPLFHPGRQVKEKEKAAEDTASPLAETRILETRSFAAFGGKGLPSGGDRGFGGVLELSVHNYLHVFIGGDMATVDKAPLDPLFWVSHAYLDYLWAGWQKSHPNVAAPVADWAKTKFAFLDAGGKELPPITPEKVLDTVALDYEYARLPK